MAPPSTSRRSLDSLPIELLAQIARYLPRSSAVAFGLVARRFTLPAEHGIWRKLDLSPSPSYGKCDLVKPMKRSHWSVGPYYEPTRDEAIRAKNTLSEGSRRKTKEIMVASNARRLGMVETAIVTPHEGAIYGAISFLDMVAPNLTSLELGTPASSIFSECWSVDDNETLDVRWLTSRLSFPSLTHLRIQQHSVRFAEFLLVLCQAAPNLLSLDADINHRMDPPIWEKEGSALATPAELKATRLSYLRLAFTDRNYRDEEEEENADDHAVVSILVASPHLRQVSLLDYSEDHPTTPSVIKALAKMTKLCDLHFALCGYMLWVLADHFEPCAEGQFSSLRRLVFRYDTDGPLDFINHFPQLPALEQFYIEYQPDDLYEYPAPTEYPEWSPTLSMAANFAEALRGSPRLVSIHAVSTIDSGGVEGVFDRLDEHERVRQTGTVRSLYHGVDEKLVHVRLLLPQLEEVEDAWDDEGLESISIELDGTVVTRYYAPRGDRESACQDFTDFGGRTVPLEILQKMRFAAGVGLGEWKGRGVDVGEKAWAVLTKWRDAEVAKQQSLAAV